MKKFIVSLTLLYLPFVYTLAYGKVKVYLDESRENYIMAEELDCDVYEENNGIGIGFKLGAFLFNIGPEITFGKTNGIEWDEMVQGIIARYKELCIRFNSGAVTLEEYKERIKEIDQIAKEALALQEKILDRVEDQSKEAFKELNRETKELDP